MASVAESPKSCSLWGIKIFSAVDKKELTTRLAVNGIAMLQTI